MASIIVTGNAVPIARKTGTTVSQPHTKDAEGTIRSRKVSSEHHFRTKMETSAAALDMEITDQDWKDRFSFVWNNAPTKDAFEHDFEAIRSDAKSYYDAKKEPVLYAACIKLLQGWMAQCFKDGFPMYCRDEADTMFRKDKRAAKRANRMCPRAERKR